MKKNLFIIGNGFDLDHYLPTKYNDFLEFLSSDEGAELGGKILVGNIERLYGYSRYEFWNDFEKNLGELFPNVVLDETLHRRNVFNSEFDYENLDDSTMLNHIYKEFYSGLQLLDELVQRWVEQIDIKWVEPEEKYIELFDSDSLFITFNYTKVLEEIYDVLDEKIYHLHGSVDDEPIMGHGRDHVEDWHPESVLNDDLTNEFNRQISNWIKGFHSSSKKDVQQFLRGMDNWLSSEKDDIDKIIVLGHSLGEVDYGYFKHLISILPKNEWFISYFDELDRVNKIKHLKHMEYDKEEVRLFKMDDLSSFFN